MNQAFQFDVVIEKRSNGGVIQEDVWTTGSQETRARRRLLDHYHDAGYWVRQITCVQSMPCPPPTDKFGGPPDVS